MTERIAPIYRQGGDTAPKDVASGGRIALGIGLPFVGLLVLSWAVRKTLHAVEIALESRGAAAATEPMGA